MHHCRGARRAISFSLFHHQPQPADPAEHWGHDRSIIASWLQREAGGHFDGAETRGDGSSFIAFASPLGQITVHDYWSFCRPDFQAASRTQSYAQILSRQVPVLTLGYTRPDAPSAARSELVVFLNGEVTVVQGYSEAFGPLMASLRLGALVAIENSRAATDMKIVDLYADPFLVSVIDTIRRQTLKPPSSPVHPAV